MYRKSVLLGLVLMTAIAAVARAQDFGVVVMAHGGSDEWNEGVLEAVEPLRRDHAIEVAFGMADAVSIQSAVTRLEDAGADRIGVVRLFISGDSWYDRTRQILGVIDGAPSRPANDPTASHDMGEMGHSMEFWRVDADAGFAVSVEGLSEAPEMGVVLADRARRLSTDPAREDVLILAHGPEDDKENERWIRYMEAHAAVIRAAMPFHEIVAETLREDWPDKRALAEQRIRQYVETAAEEGRSVIVLPFRVHGFGPYEAVLEGLDYIADGRGLVPHDSVTEWIERQIIVLERELRAQAN